MISWLMSLLQPKPQLTLLFLDDEREFNDVTWIDYPQYAKVIVLRNSEEFSSAFFQEDGSMVDMSTINISFDHDLADYDQTGKEVTGYDCLKWLVEVCLDENKQLPVCFFHTQNPIGRFNMESYYNLAYKHLESTTQGSV